MAEIKTTNWNAPAPIIVNPPPVTAVKGTEKKD